MEYKANKWLEYLLLIAVLSATGVWYISNISGALWIDEATLADSGYFLVTGGDLYLDATHPPLAKYLTGIGQVFFGHNQVGARAPILLCGIFSLLLVYMICRRLCGFFGGIFGVILVGSTRLFATLSVQALYEIPMLLFVLYLVYLTINRERFRNRKGFFFMLGVFYACLFSTKEFGMIFMLLIGIYWFFLLLNSGKLEKIPFMKNMKYLLILVAISPLLSFFVQSQFNYNWGLLTDFERDYVVSNLPLIEMIVGNPNNLLISSLFLFFSVMMFFVLWLFAVFILSLKERDAIYFVLGMGITLFLVYLPYLYNIFYVLLRPVLNAVLLSSAIPSSTTIPAIKSELGPVIYLYWMCSYGCVFYISAGIISLIHYFIHRKSYKTGPLLLLFLVPLLIIGFMSIREERYLATPLVMMSIALTVYVSKAFSSFKRNLSPLAFILLLLPLSPLTNSLANPVVGVDSGFDVAAELVMDIAGKNPETLTVLSWHDYSLRYYLTDEIDINLPEFWSAGIFDQILDSISDVDLVILTPDTVNTFPNSETIEYIVSNSKQVINIKYDLNLHVMNEDVVI